MEKVQTPQVTNSVNTDLKYKVDDVPPKFVALLLALQHILAAFAGIVAVPLVVLSLIHI